ncbi:SGNH/GDSL hydrolase family protein [Paenibacillus sp. J2TS4]|uniref:SGNH/GDSL hydrolase family protein n=1 Tax=Paenibacillus sp. J2TS4 TaxID=2807194 RepID=UPI001B006D87|nr:SGNH/GDSL hydrolase family protein [Paenibacillus sp. J2TS4]GIP31679.1 lysophospholipase [Paenibacillus sp. J2TS4]
MNSEKMMELMQDQDFKEVMQAIMMKNSEEQKKSTQRKYRALNQYAAKGQTLFVGSSLMEWFPINEMQLTLNLKHIIYNRGIAGSTTADLLEVMDDCIFDLAPSKIFINIGSNDIGSVGPNGYEKETLLANYNKIMEQIKERLPQCEVYVMAYYPINAKADYGLDKSRKAMMFATRTNSNILEANTVIEELANKHGFHFINVNEGLTDEDGNLKAEFSTDGVHMWPGAYAVILENLKKYL